MIEASPLHVMHVVYSLQPGGMEHGVVKLVNGLDPRRVRSSICSTTPGGALAPLVQRSVPVHALRRRAGNDPRLVWDMVRLFRRERPQIVHTHAWGTLVEGLVAARLAGVPVVVHGEHGTLQLKSRQRFVQRRAWAFADRVLSVSSRLAERIARETGFPVDRISVIRNGVDLDRFGATERGAARQALGLGDDEVVAVAVGRLVPVKDHRTLLEAVAQARRGGTPCTLMLVGDGPLREPLAAAANNLGIADAVRFLGHRSDVEAVLAAADVFVLSSVSEGLSNTILEAMAAGRPVIATRVGGADEMVVDGVTGLLVDPSSPDALAAALAMLFADGERRRSMGEAGRLRVETEFSLRGMVQRYEAVYLQLASSDRREMVSSPEAPRVAHNGTER